jgi:hypothetical protein
MYIVVEMAGLPRNIPSFILALDLCYRVTHLTPYFRLHDVSSVFHVLSNQPVVVYWPRACRDHS